MTALSLLRPGWIPLLSQILLLRQGWQIILSACLFYLLYVFFSFLATVSLTVDEQSLAEKAENGSLSARLLLREMADSSRFADKIAAGQTFYLSIFAYLALSWLFARLLPYMSSWAEPLRIILAVIILLLIFFFAYLPSSTFSRQIGGDKAKESICKLIFPYKLLILPVLPISTAGAFLGRVLAKIFKLGSPKKIVAATEEDLRLMLSASKEAGHIQEQDQDLIENIFEFDNKSVGEIMTHRTNISAFPVTEGLENVMARIDDDQYTRYPVFEDSIDNIVGIVHVKDILSWLYEREDQEFKLAELMRIPQYTPESRIIRDLFQEMQQNRVQMAVVIDEYGGTAGIVTLEDIVEEIVGEIEDEYDEEEKSIIRVQDNEWLLDGAVELDLVADCCQIELPTEDYDTVAGMIIAYLDRIPEEGEKPEVAVNGARFIVEEVHDKRIARVRLLLAEEEPGS